MNMDTVMNYIQSYGHFMIFLFMFFGIVGIPAPEESLVFFIGVLIAQHRMAAVSSASWALLGVFAGMIFAYAGGRLVGYPLLNKFGKYIGVTRERWEKAKHKLENNVNRTILFGFYMPGIRQISPYLAGIANVGVIRFVILSAIGSILWIVPFLLAGFFIGRTFNINPDYVPFIGLLFLAVFIVYVLVKWLRKRKKKRKRL
ncbi:DedA family protein [Aciduricibacillus chroicocephali]|uniref:DedA family protein n=1 Tax=Aciduricibacillus chroicocephali TaxID=3054939 RepID=A0ABY9KWZ7_9BACI|nr:DedA family protein [Bacillaceae bacterium 44XB]